MEYMFANTVDSIINVFFKGGMEEFDKLGRITIIPAPAKEVCIYHPDLKGEIVTKLTAANNNKGMNTTYIMSEKNFPDLDDQGVLDMHLTLCKNIERLDPNANLLLSQKSNLVVITFPDIKSEDDSILNLVFGMLRNTDGLKLAYVITATSVYRIVPNKKSKQIPKIEENKEHGIITQDDITNLIIDLERSKSSEDLL
jgi:hypothetical protein